jgi:hypothetical protein
MSKKSSTPASSSSTQADRVEYLTTKYKRDFDTFHDPYVELCREAHVEPLDLSTHKFDRDVATIGLGALEDACNEHIATLEAQRPNLKKKRREMKTAAARKKEDSAGDKEPPCVKCGARKFLGLTSKACDNNYTRLPSGRIVEGYMPMFTGLSMLGGDGVSLELCITCGAIRDLDLAKLREEIDEYEEENEE